MQIFYTKPINVAWSESLARLGGKTSLSLANNSNASAEECHNRPIWLTSLYVALIGIFLATFSICIIPNDAQAQPVIKLESDTTSVTEGADVIFTYSVSSGGAPTANLIINISITNTMGNFLTTAQSMPRTVQLDAGETSDTHTVTTHDDSNDEPNGKFTFALLADSSSNSPALYTLTQVMNEETSIEVAVADNDPTLPLLELSSTATEVEEGGDIPLKVSITNNVTFSSSTTVAINFVPVNVYGDIIRAPAFSVRSYRNPIFGTSDMEKIVNVTTFVHPSNNWFYSSGSIQFSIIGGRGEYENPRTNTVTINVIDNNVPTLSITNARGGLEGSTFSFDIIASVAPKPDRSIQQASRPSTMPITLSQPSSGYFDSFSPLGDPTKPNIVAMPIGATKFSVSVVSTTMNTEAMDGTITVTLQADRKHYKLHATDITAVLSVANADEPRSRISISSPVASFTEGERTTVNFELSATMRDSTSEDLTVVYEVTDTGNVATTVGSGSGNIVIRATRTSEMLSVTFISDNTVIDGTREFKLEIVINSSTSEIEYLPNNTNNAHIATVMVLDNDPNISISSVRNTINEGNETVSGFFVSSNLNVPSDVTVAVKLTDPSGYLNSSFELTQTVKIFSDSSRSVVPLTIIDNHNTTSDGTITATLMDGTDYFVVNPDFSTLEDSAMITVKSFPSISISSPVSSFTEGETTTVNFALSSTVAAPAGGFTIGYEVTNPGNFANPIGTGTNRINIPAGMTTAMLPVTFKSDNQTIDGTREFKIEIKPDTASSITYIPNTTNDAHFATIMILDNDPNISIAPATGKSTVDQGDMVELVITSNINVPTNLTIMVELTDPNNVLATGVNLIQPVVITQGTKSKPLSIATKTTNEGTITAMIMAGTNYFAVNPDFSTLEHTTMVRVKTLPRISISSAVSSFTEGKQTSVSFELSSTMTAPSGGLTIAYEVTDLGSFAATIGTGTDNVVMQAGRTSAMLAVTFKSDNDIVDGNREFKIEIETDSASLITYRPNTASDAHIATLMILDNDPNISIAPATGKSIIEEGSMVEFVVTSNVNAPSNLTIMVTLTDPNDILATSVNLNQEVIISQGTKSKPLSVATVDNPGTRDEGDITAMIMAGSNYFIVNPTFSDLEHTAMVTVESSLTISISSTVNSIKEGEATHAIFTISATSLPETNPLKIKYLPEGQNFLASSITSGMSQTTAFTFSTTAPFTTTLQVPIEDDDNAERNGLIKVTIEAAETPTTDDYQVAVGDAASATIIVIDDDALIPELTISGPVNPIFENAGPITLTITANMNPGRTLVVDYTPSDDAGDFLADAIEEKQSTSALTLTADGAGNFLSTFEVALMDDNDPEFSGEVSVTLELENVTDDAQRTYTLPSNGSKVTFRILDTEVPELNIQAGANAYEAMGATADFFVTASFLPTAGLAVRYTPESDNFLAVGESEVLVTTNPPLTFRESSGVISSMLSVNIDLDEVTDPDGTIKVTLELDDNTPITYSVGPSSSAVVKVSEFKMSISDSFLNEGNESDPDQSIMNFVVTISPAAVSSVSVNWNIVEEQGENIAELVSDFQLPPSINRRIVFERGETTKTIPVLIIRDEINEPNETFIVMLSDPPDGVQLTKASATGRIVNDDVEQLSSIYISISADTNSITEGTPATFTLDSDQGVTSEGFEVHISVSDPGSYLAWRVPRTVNINTVPHTLTFETRDDEIVDGDSTISVTVLTIPGSYQVVDGEDNDSVDITDNDTAETIEDLPRISVAQVAVNTIIMNIDDLLGGTSASPPVESAPIPTRPTISISVVNTQIEEGAAAGFIIMTKQGGNTPNIIVSLQVHQERVNIAEPANLNIQLSGQNSSSLSISTLNDDHAGEDGFVTVTILEDPSYLIATNEGVATVSVSDAVDRQNRQDLLTSRVNTFMPDVVGNMTARRSEIITQRVQQGFSESNNNVVNFGGIATIDQLITRSGEMTNEGSVSWRELLGDSSFAITLLSGDDFVTPATIWGIGDRRELTSSSSNHTQDWTGDTFTGQLGIDTLIGEEILTGVSASFSENDIEIDGNNDQDFTFSLSSTSLNPYIGWTSTSQNAELRTVVGYGVGELTIDQSNYSREALASRSYSLALAGRKKLYSSDTILNGITKLSVIGDSWFARQYLNGQDDLITNLQTDAQYYNIRTEGTHQYEFEGGSSLTPLISVGIRKDTKNQRSTLAIEFTGGLDYDTPIGLTVTSSGYLLVTDENTIQKISARSTLGYDRGNDNLGLTITVSPKWGQTLASAQNTLWNSNILTSNNNIGQYTDGTQINSKVGYGFVLGEHSQTLSVYSGYKFDDQTEDELLLGSRVAIGSNFGLDIEGTRKISSTRDEASKFKLNGRLKW